VASRIQGTRQLRRVARQRHLVVLAPHRAMHAQAQRQFGELVAREQYATVEGRYVVVDQKAGS
jgi:hypothetical protein